MTYRSKLGVLCLVRIMIQSNEVESRLDLITLTSEHMISAGTLTAHLITPAGIQEVRTIKKKGKERKQTGKKCVC